MTPCIAIHHREGSFSDRWLAYCRAHAIRYKIVNAYANNILQDLAGCAALMWHWHHVVPRDVMIARTVLRAVEAQGLVTYPEHSACWHYDDKVAQKYLLEGLGAPLVPTTVLYRLDEALAWIDETSFPKVFKLRRGAGGQNVRLVRTPAEAVRIARQAFGRGFKPVAGYTADMRTKLRKKQSRAALIARIARLPRTLTNIYRQNRLLGRERNYLYFQDYIPGNTHDIRIVVIGDKACAYRRSVRPGDFRASGHGVYDFDTAAIPSAAIESAFSLSQQMGATSMAYDYLVASDGRPLLVEMSYSFGTEGFSQCTGYYTRDMQWHTPGMQAEEAILQAVRQKIQ